MPEFIISPNDYEFKVLDKEKHQSEIMKGQKPVVIDLFGDDGDDDDDPIQQDERDNDQTGMLLMYIL
jgi:hypothetical protein